MTSLAVAFAALVCLTVSEAEDETTAHPVVKTLVLEDVNNNDQNCSAPAGEAGTRTANKVRMLRAEIDECEDEYQRLRLEHRLEPSDHHHWRHVRPLQFAEEAQRMAVERELLEALLLAVVVDDAKRGRQPYSHIRVNTLAELAWLIFEKNMAEVEEHLRLLSSESIYGSDLELSMAGILYVPSRWRGPRANYAPLEAAFAAIDSYRDERARDYLLDLALKESEGEDRSVRGRMHCGWLTREIAGFRKVDVVRMRAWMLLLHYDPRAIPDFERALEAAIVASSADPKMTEVERTRASSTAVRSYLVQLAYIDSLDPYARQRYHRITTLLTFSVALAGPRKTDGGKPDLVISNWQDGDERFLPHMFMTGGTLARQGYWLLTSAPISSKGLAWLKQEADSGDWPPWAERILANRLSTSEGKQ